MLNLSSTMPGGENASKRWADPGFVYPPRKVTHESGWQNERLSAADVDPSRYGDVAETGLFGLDCFVSMVDAGLDIDGYIFVDQEFHLRRAPRLGESVMVTGEVLDTHLVGRGLMVDEIYRFHDADGALCIETRLRGVLALPSNRIDPSKVRPMPERAALPLDSWKPLESKQLSPAKVRQFSEDVGNDIHFDADAAQAHGFRAPLAQGVMSAVYLIGGLARARAPTAFDIKVSFLRPVFWDAQVSLWQRGEIVSASDPLMLQSRNAEGKVTAHLAATALTYS